LLRREGLALQAVVLQRHLCIESSLGLRLVLANFGTVSIQASLLDPAMWANKSARCVQACLSGWCVSQSLGVGAILFSGSDHVQAL
jgi:hypothetical protein